MRVQIRDVTFNPYQEIERYQGECASRQDGKYGATACFIGTMRDFNDNRKVEGMLLEHYPGMTERHITRICEQASEQWSLLDCLVIHRIGHIDINEPIVVIAVWAGHRGDAMDASRFIIENLKSKAPFWKKEKVEQGSVWVKNNTSGYEK